MQGKQNAQRIGKQAEISAKCYLEQQGLVLISENYSCKLGEIDLIMDDADQVVFIEVKYRKSASYGSSIEMVNPRKQKKIILTARHYLHQHHLTETISSRFDIIGIVPNQPIQWLKNAFYSE
ncbi:YraN family protein [Candidatus Endobugula sertula]|uniref:UPF0102 protein AB835_01355 n=1 Tax=Candidatus Endobugula sertula TaxID=62101 RepID=A0A1D2QTU9_9GAMM|nr:YraN family protein [Candidatus Endobugula sertula]